MAVYTSITKEELKAFLSNLMSAHCKALMEYPLELQIQIT